MKVLITDGDERSALAVTRALGQAHAQVMVGAESAHSLAAASRYCWQSFSYPSPYMVGDGFVSCLLDQVKRHNITAVFPISDIAMKLVGAHLDEFEKYTSVPMPPVQAHEDLSDKHHLLQLAGGLGIPIPDTQFVPDGLIESSIDLIREFPVVVKPAHSLVYQQGIWEKTSVFHARNVSELKRLYREVDYLRHPSLVQRRIEGEGRGLFVLMDRGKALVTFAHRRLRERPPAGGVSVLRESIAPPQPMTDYALRLLEHVAWHGVAMVEFKVDRRSGFPVLMEVNGRFWGSLQLALDAGVNFPFFLLQLATGGAVGPIPHHYKVGVKSRWLLGDLDHLLLRLFKPEVELHLPPGSPSKWETLMAFFQFFESDTRSEVLRRDDPRPFIYELRQYLRTLFRVASC